MPKLMPKKEDPPDQRVLDFMSRISELFNDTEFSDTTIRLGDIELPAHRLVLSTQSEYFARALSEKFGQAETGVFQYSEGSMHAYWRCFEYIYTGQYAESPAAGLAAFAGERARPHSDCDDVLTVGGSVDDDELIKDVRVYELAQYFDIAGLKTYSATILENKVKFLSDKEKFVDCVRDVYASTVNAGDELRRVAAKATQNHLEELWDKPLQDLLREGGDFAVDLMALVKSTPPPVQVATFDWPK